jgi:hypothetical protein
MKKVLISGILAVLLVSPAFAKTFSLPKADPIAKIDFPDGWKVEAEDESLDANSDDDEIYINVEVDDADSIEGAIEETFGYLKKNSVKIDKASEKKTEAKLNGMDVVDFAWDGEDKDGPAKVGVTIVQVTPKKGLLILYWASPEGEKKHQPELNSIIQSLKPAK